MYVPRRCAGSLELDQLGRSFKNLIDVVTELDTLGIGFRSVTESIRCPKGPATLPFRRAPLTTSCDSLANVAPIERPYDEIIEKQ